MKITYLFLVTLFLLGCSAPAEKTLTDTDYLELALFDEYKAHATYEQILLDFGDVRPFTNIIRAEQNHFTRLENYYVSHSLTIPEFSFDPPTFATVAEACAAGVVAEQENIALYDQIIPQIQDPELAMIFTALQRASQDNHLPAFERCS